MLITEENIFTFLASLQGADEIGVDTETTGLDVRNKRDYLMGIGLAGNKVKGYIPFRHKEDNLPRQWLEPVVDLLQEKDLVFHNRKFDMHSLKTIGIDPLEFKGLQFDTLLLSHLYNEELYTHALEFLTKKYLGLEKDEGDVVHEMGKIYGWENISAKAMAEYGAQDPWITLQLKRYLWPRLKNEGLDDVYLTTEMPFTNILYEMEQRGVGVNIDFTKDKAVLGRSRMATITRELGFNPASPKALGKFLLEEMNLPIFAHTGSCEDCKKGYKLDGHIGKPSFNKIAMAEYDDILSVQENPSAKRITEYRGWQKAVTSLYEPLLELTGPDGLIRTSFKQHGTVTGRLSAAHPNLQQVPRGSDNPWNGDAKSAFHSGREGFTLIGWDYSQLELRLAAAYGNESLLIEEFKKPDADPFNVLAPLIFGELTKDTRHQTKTFVYANLYGAGLPKIAMQLGRPLSEVEGLYARYKNSIQGIMEVSSRVSKLVAQRGYVKYWDGRRRHIRNKRDSYKAWNSVCQGGGAQLVKRAMIRCKGFEDENCFMVMQVHDEITFAIRNEMIHHYEPLIIEAMIDWPGFGVTMSVEGKEWK